MRNESVSWYEYGMGKPFQHGSWPFAAVDASGRLPARGQEDALCLAEVLGVFWAGRLARMLVAAGRRESTRVSVVTLLEIVTPSHRL